MKPATIYYIRTNGSIERKPNTQLTLAEMQAFVGGYIEHLPVVYKKQPSSMIVNEDGKLKGLPVNVVATTIFQQSHPGVGDYIVGDAFIIEGGLHDEEEEEPQATGRTP